MNPPSQRLARFLALIPGRTLWAGDGYLKWCPAATHRTMMLKVTEPSEGRILARCEGGCSDESLRAKLGLAIPEARPTVSEVQAQYTATPQPGSGLPTPVHQHARMVATHSGTQGTHGTDSDQ